MTLWDIVSRSQNSVAWTEKLDLFSSDFAYTISVLVEYIDLWTITDDNKGPAVNLAI